MKLNEFKSDMKSFARSQAYEWRRLIME